MTGEQTPQTDDPESAPASPELTERGTAQVDDSPAQNNVLVMIGGVVIVALLLFFVWQGDGEDAKPTLATPQPEQFESPARVEPPPVPERTSASTPEPAPQAPPQYDPYADELRRMALQQAEAERRLAEQRRRSPVLIMNQRRNPTAPAQAQTAAYSGSAITAMPASKHYAGGNGMPGMHGVPTNGYAQNNAYGEDAFTQRVSQDVETVSAAYLAAPSQMVPQGTTIAGVLETAIHSDLPGYIRAIVSQDVYAFDGSRRLIPKGSRLIGQYKSGLVRGQARLFVIWTRLLRPDGASILVGSPGTDGLGRAGVGGVRDSHFFQIFGSSLLLSLLDGAIEVAVEKARERGDNSTTIIQDDPGLSRAAELALENSINIPPTIHVAQGTPIQVFVAKDLDFRQVALR